MIYPIERLIKDQALVTINEKESVRNALTKMIQNDFSQLPIVRNDGILCGLISEKSITRNLFHLGDKVSILNLNSVDCKETPASISVESDVLDVLSLLRQTSSVVIVDRQKAVGIVTNADLISYFRDYSEGLVLIEDVETTLRYCVENTLTTDEAREIAITNSFKHLAKANGGPPVTFDRMSFNDYVNLIVNKNNWIYFETLFANKNLFQIHMEQVRDIRNQIVHFRGRLSAVQYDLLKRSHDWLNSQQNRFKSNAITESIENRSSESIKSEISPSDTNQTVSRYYQFEDWLYELADEYPENQKIIISFSDIEKATDDELPESARKHSTWWSNDLTVSRQALAWLRAGWEVTSVDFTDEEVTLIRRDKARYQPFWEELKSHLLSRKPELIQEYWSGPENWKRFTTAIHGVYYGWNFSNKGIFFTYLVIDTGDKDQNLKHYEKLSEFRDAIDSKFSEPLKWDSRPQYPYIFISLEQEFDNLHIYKLDELEMWGVDTMVELINAMQPYIKEL